jgi:hypothetical protein
MIVQAAGVSYLRGAVRGCSGVKQEVFLLRKNPGRPLASLFSPLPGGLALTFL